MADEFQDEDEAELEVLREFQGNKLVMTLMFHQKSGMDHQNEFEND